VSFFEAEDFMREDVEGSQWRPASEGVDVEGFGNVIEGGKVIVHFWAPWNPYDKQLDGNLLGLVGEFGKRFGFGFYAVNADETAFGEVMERFHVGALPALLCFVNGRVKGRFYGVETVEKLRVFLEEMGN
jgi:thioredoxin-like negative regulator of GroEL